MRKVILDFYAYKVSCFEIYKYNCHSRYVKNNHYLFSYEDGDHRRHQNIRIQLWAV